MGRGPRRRPGQRVARRSARRRADARRRAHAAVDGAGRCCRRGPRLPGPGRPGQPGPAAQLPVRRAAADRVRVRPARFDADVGPSRPRGRAGRHGPANRRDPLLPGPPGCREHRLRPRAGRCGRGRGRHRVAAVLLLAAHRGRRSDRHAAGRRCDRGHGAGVGWFAAGRGRSGRHGRGVGRRCARPARRADPAGPVPDLLALAMERQRRRADSARLGDPGRDPGVRRPADHRPVLVQGDRPGRPDLLRGRPGAHRASRGHRGEPRAAAARPARATARRRHAVGVPDQALPDRQRGRARHPGVHRAPARRTGRRGLRHRRRRRTARGQHPGRRRPDPCPDCGRGPGRAVADRGPARRQSGAHHRGDLPRLVRRARRRTARRRRRQVGSAAGRPVRRPIPGPGRRDRAGRAAGRQRGGDGAATARVRRPPGRDLPRPGPPAQPPLPRHVPLAARGVRRPRDGARR